MTVIQPHITDGIRRMQRYIAEQLQVIKDDEVSILVISIYSGVAHERGV